MTAFVYLDTLLSNWQKKLGKIIRGFFVSDIQIFVRNSIRLSSFWYLSSIYKLSSPKNTKLSRQSILTKEDYPHTSALDHMKQSSNSPRSLLNRYFRCFLIFPSFSFKFQCNSMLLIHLSDDPAIQDPAQRWCVGHEDGIGVVVAEDSVWCHRFELVSRWVPGLPC